MPDPTELADFCRQIETYLCQKNEGHLIRVVGPSFDLVAGWARRGVPLKVAFRGIDRTVERYYRQGSRRRPLKIDFCDADVLDVFDEWRRATGVTAAVAPATDDAGSAAVPPDGAPAPRRGPSLADHLERVLLRLTDARTSGRLTEIADPLIDRISSELDAVKRVRGGLRGEPRVALLERLEAADGELLELARATIPRDELAAIERESTGEIAPFQTQMTVESFERARRAAADAALRERLRLPTVSLA